MPDLHCPYCGHTQSDPKRCEACGGLFEPLSRQATRSAMGPWYIRDEDKPFMPGFSVQVLRKQAAAGRIGPQTLVRGPTTQQFWMPALEVPGLSRLLGICHACSVRVSPNDTTCSSCSADLSLPEDRDHLGITNTTDQAAAASMPSRPKVSPPSRSPSPPKSEPAAFDADADHVHDEHEADELWDAAVAPRRRPSRKRGQDPVIIVLGVVAAMCAIGVVILALSIGAKDKPGGGDADGDVVAKPGEEGPQASTPRRAPSEQAISDIQIRIELITERLQDADVPGPLQAELDALLAREAIAQGAIDEGRLTEGYDILLEIAAEAQEIEDAVQNYDEHAEVLKLQAAAIAARELALGDEAPDWAPQVWAEAEQALADGQAAVEAGDDFNAYDLMVKAQSDFEFAQSQASLGFLAVQAQSELEDEIGGIFTVNELAAHGGEAWAEMLQRRTSGEKELAAYDYGAALGSFETALRRLQQARSGVRLAQGVMFYAFAAGYQATDALIAIAAGDGLTVEKRGLIEDAYDDLRLEVSLSRELPAGTSPDFAATADVLVNQAREAIASQHGTAAQISYRIGFEFRIIEQTLSNPTLSASHRSRISRSLQELDELTALANYAPAIRERFDTFRRALRSTSTEEKLQAARDEWSDLIVVLRTYDQAMPIVNPSATEIEDPEMFPDH